MHETEGTTKARQSRLFDATHFDALAAIESDTGGRELIVDGDDAAPVETDDSGVVRDINCRDDIDHLD